MDEGAITRLRTLTYWDLKAYRHLLTLEMLSDPIQLDRGVVAIASACLGKPVVVSDLPTEITRHLRETVHLGVKRFIADR